MKKILEWILRIIPAAILLQSLFFKFSGAPESIYIFKEMGMEPWGRYLIGSLELLAAITLLVPKTSALGALLAFGIMLGAIGGHLTQLGIEVQGDGGSLFIMAIIVAATTGWIAYKNRLQLAFFVGKKVKKAL